LAQFLIGDDLEQRIMTQTVGIVGVFVAGHDLIEALPQQGQGIVMHAVILTRIAEQLGQVTGQMVTLIEAPQKQKTGIAGDLAPGKIGADGLMTVEGEVQLW
jgi:hypothetical protein